MSRIRLTQDGSVGIDHEGKRGGLDASENAMVDLRNRVNAAPRLPDSTQRARLCAPAAPRLAACP